MSTLFQKQTFIMSVAIQPMMTTTTTTQQQQASNSESNNENNNPFNATIKAPIKKRPLREEEDGNDKDEARHVHREHMRVVVAGVVAGVVVVDAGCRSIVVVVIPPPAGAEEEVF